MEKISKWIVIIFSTLVLLFTIPILFNALEQTQITVTCEESLQPLESYVFMIQGIDAIGGDFSNQHYELDSQFISMVNMTHSMLLVDGFNYLVAQQFLELHNYEDLFLPFINYAVLLELHASYTDINQDIRLYYFIGTTQEEYRALIGDLYNIINTQDNFDITLCKLTIALI